MRLNTGNYSSKIGNGTAVEVRNGNLEVALKIFKRRVKNNKVLIEYKDNMEFQKKSDKLRKARMIGKSRAYRYQESKKPLF